MPLSAADATLLLHAMGLPSIAAERPVTKSVIGAIPADQADYRPDPVTRSAIDLAWHIVTAEVRFLDAVASSVFDLTPRDRPASVRTPSDINDWFESESQRAVARLQAASGEDLVRTIDFRGIFQFPAVVYVTLA